MTLSVYQADFSFAMHLFTRFAVAVCRFFNNNIAAGYQVDIAIVDFNMFPLDGVEFTRLVRNSPDSANPYLPIIMMTGHSGKQRVYEARDAGVTEFLAKPITAKGLLGALASVLNKEPNLVTPPMISA